MKFNEKLPKNVSETLLDIIADTSGRRFMKIGSGERPGVLTDEVIALFPRKNPMARKVVTIDFASAVETITEVKAGKQENIGKKIVNVIVNCSIGDVKFSARVSAMDFITAAQNDTDSFVCKVVYSDGKKNETTGVVPVYSQLVPLSPSTEEDTEKYNTVKELVEEPADGLTA